MLTRAAVMPDLIQPGTGEHSAYCSTAGLRDETDKQADEGRECRCGKAEPEHGQEVGQRARYGGAGKHRRITLTRVVRTPSMLSPSPSKITDLAIPGASSRPTDLAAPAKLRNTRAWISDPIEGARHDVFCLDESGALDTLNPRDWTGDKGYVGRAMITPIKKTTTRQELLDWQKTFNTAINKTRAVVERVIANLKNWRILHTDYRRPLDTFRTTISAAIGLMFYSMA